MSICKSAYGLIEVCINETSDTQGVANIDLNLGIASPTLIKVPISIDNGTWSSEASSGWAEVYFQGPLGSEEASLMQGAIYDISNILKTLGYTGQFQAYDPIVVGNTLVFYFKASSPQVLIVVLAILIVIAVIAWGIEQIIVHLTPAIPQPPAPNQNPQYYQAYQQYLQALQQANVERTTQTTDVTFLLILGGGLLFLYLLGRRRGGK